jgi:hypothetical protein
LEPNPRPLKREFIELIRSRARKAYGRGKRRMDKKDVSRLPLSANVKPSTLGEGWAEGRGDLG